MKFYLFYILLLPLTSLLVASPLSDTEQEQLNPVKRIELHMPAAQKVLENSTKKALRNPRPLQIAQAAPVMKSLTDLSSWEFLDTRAIIRLQIDANDARHLNFGLEKLSLPDSARLYIRDAKSGVLLQSYSAENVVKDQIWTPQLLTNSVLFELQVDASQQHQTQVFIRQAGLGDKDFSASSWLKSGSCNIDIACPEGDNWRDVSRSVSRYIISDANGSYACTGTLMNNDRLDQRPLLLTAAHCLVAESTAASMVFYWNYETSVCGATPDGSFEQNTAGARFIARSEGIDSRSDFALVELIVPPPNDYNVFYSGWNAIDQGAADVVTIHHPQGDEKRISIDRDALEITAYGEDVEDQIAQYFRVIAWDAGTTEGGSSGSGIWNQNKELIGTLSGGDASCAAPEASDWYGRMANHWNSAGDHPLVVTDDFLAPSFGMLQLDGLDSCAGANITIQSDINRPLPNQPVNLSATLSGGIPPYEYQWDFENDGQVDDSTASPLHRFNSPGIYTVYLSVTDSNLCRTSNTLQIITPDASEGFIVNGLAPANLIKPADANAGWVVTDDTASEGSFSLRAEIVNENEVAAIERTALFTEGDISFSYKVSSEAGIDSLRFSIDGVQQLVVDGEIDWTSVSYAIAAGSRTLRWEYTKDASVSDGVDTAWIDGLQFTAAQPMEPPRKNSGGSMPLIMMVILLFGLVVRLYKTAHNRSITIRS